MVVVEVGTLAPLLAVAVLLADGPLPHGQGAWLTELWVTGSGFSPP
ncbi:hypothetical protein [Streptomyces scabiei]|nr:hypothetical protein [Streptomyces scabiei]MDX3517816.1 hypothetical protein [Streptomyces scabiei]